MVSCLKRSFTLGLDGGDDFLGDGRGRGVGAQVQSPGFSGMFMKVFGLACCTRWDAFDSQKLKHRRRCCGQTAGALSMPSSVASMGTALPSLTSGLPLYSPYSSGMSRKMPANLEGPHLPCGMGCCSILAHIWLVHLRRAMPSTHSTRQRNLPSSVPRPSKANFAAQSSQATRPGPADTSFGG